MTVHCTGADALVTGAGSTDSVCDKEGPLAVLALELAILALLLSKRCNVDVLAGFDAGLCFSDPAKPGVQARKAVGGCPKLFISSSPGQAPY